MKKLFSKPLFWSNVAAFLVTGFVVAGVALAWNNPTVAPAGGSGAISADSSGNAVLTGLCFGADCRGSWPMSNIQVFNVSGSWTVPVGVKKITAEVWGGGGGASSYGAGGGGGYGKEILAVNPGETLTVIVGTGGAPASYMVVAAAGGATSIMRGATVLISATGGGGTTKFGGTSSAKENITGGEGGYFQIYGGIYYGEGSGGSSPRGGLGGHSVYDGSTIRAGYSPPSVPGGGAGADAGNPGSGAKGRVTITY